MSSCTHPSPKPTKLHHHLWFSEVRESVVQGHPQVHATFENSLDCRRPCVLKEEKKFSLFQNEVLMPLARSEEASHWCLRDVVLSWEHKTLFSLHKQCGFNQETLSFLWASLRRSFVLEHTAVSLLSVCLQTTTRPCSFSFLERGKGTETGWCQYIISLHLHTALIHKSSQSQTSQRKPWWVVHRLMIKQKPPDQNCTELRPRKDRWGPRLGMSGFCVLSSTFSLLFITDFQKILHLISSFLSCDWLNYMFTKVSLKNYC